MHHAKGEDDPAKQNIAQPVGGDAKREDTGDGATRQAEAGIEPVAHTNAADPGTERQVKGIANKRHQHHLPLCQLVTAIGAAQQVIAAIEQIAEDHQPDGAQQRNPVVVADHRPDVFPVHLFGVDHQQHNHGDKKQPGEDLFCQPPARM